MQTELSEKVVKVAEQYHLDQVFLMLLQEWDMEQLQAVLQMLLSRQHQAQVLLDAEKDTLLIFRLQGQIAELRRLSADIETWFKALQEDTQ